MNYLGLIKIKILFTLWLILFLSLFLLISTAPVFAIPSPELIIGSVSSLSQLFAVGFAMVSASLAALGAKFGLKRKGLDVQSSTLINSVIILALLLSGAVAYIFYQSDQNARKEHARLQETLSRPAAFTGTKILDDTLKETSLAAQNKSDLGITTENAQELLAARDTAKDTLFIDVRERAENMMGTIPGAKHIRFPDIANAGINFAGKKVVLLCHNGNRSSETCERLAAMGIDCRFIAGGLEKWIVEGREFTDRSVRGLSDLRAIPDYKNKDVLISTPMFTDLLASRDLQIIDTRYPKDFAANHLPSAINIPLRALPTQKLEQKLAALEQKPTIVACYDRRSCFMGQVLGLELAERGIDFKGRYTTPWDYFLAAPTKPHIQKWLSTQNETLWNRAINTVAGWLIMIAEQTHFIVGITLLSFISRLMILPISLKSEKDQIALTAHKSDLDAIKTRLKNDPRRRAREVQRVHKELGLTPLRNLAALLFLPVMMLGLSAIEVAAPTVRSGFLWVASLGAPDPSYLFPILVSILAGIYLQMTLARTKLRRTLTWAIAVPLLFGLVFRLTAGGAIYLTISLTLLLIQRLFVTGDLGRLKDRIQLLWQGWKISNFHHGIMPLGYPNLLKECGNKSYRLAQLSEAGFNVPQGVVVKSDILNEYVQMDAPDQVKFLDHLWQMVGQKKCVVRSSGSDEDGAGQSYAGIFDSVLDIDRAGLQKAFERVLKSFESKRAGVYEGRGTTHSANILVQQMIDAEYSGVLFTQDPVAPGQILVELAKGTADDLVSGRVTPLSLRYGKYTLRKMDKVDVPIDLTELLVTARKIETLFGCPQDIEWTYLEGVFSVVQSRDVTTLKIGSASEVARQNEWVKLFQRFSAAASDTPILKQDELSEVLPRPTPFSFSVMSSLWTAGGSVDLASSALGLQYEVPETGDGYLYQLFDKIYSDVALKSNAALQLPKWIEKDLESRSGQIDDKFHQEFLPRLHQKLEHWDALDVSKLSLNSQLEMVEEVVQYFVNDVYAFAEQINILASFLNQKANEECEARGLDMLKVMHAPTPHAPSQIIAKATMIPQAQQKDHLLQVMGHRAIFDYELALPRYSENPEMLWKLMQTKVFPIKSGSGAPSTEASIQLPEIVKLALRFQDLKEHAKHESIRVLAVLRRLLLEIDTRFDNCGRVFYLTYQEVLQCDENTLQNLKDVSMQRFEISQSLKELAPTKAKLSLHDCEILSNPLSQVDDKHGDLHGDCVSGDHDVIGKIYFALANQEQGGDSLQGFSRGDILVCKMVNPAWLPYILQSKAVVCEVGGWLSHMAIVAREHNIPMVIGCSGLGRLQHGDEVRVLKSGKIVCIAAQAENISMNA